MKKKWSGKRKRANRGSGEQDDEGEGLGGQVKVFLAGWEGKENKIGQA